MTLNIREVVESTISDAGYASALSGYTTLVDAVVEAVETAISDTTLGLLEQAVRAGVVGEETGRQYGERAGLIQPEPEPEPEVVETSASTEGESVPAWAQTLIDRFDRIEAAARRQGLQV